MDNFRSIPMRVKCSFFGISMEYEYLENGLFTQKKCYRHEDILYHSYEISVLVGHS